MKKILTFSIVTIVTLLPFSSYATESRCDAMLQVPETISDVHELIRQLPEKDEITVKTEVAKLESEIVELAHPKNGVSKCNEYSDELLKQAFTALQDIKQGFTTEFGPEVRTEYSLVK